VADIFISYSRLDLPRARQFERALDQCGWSVFWDRELLPGEGYRRAIEHELKQARCVIVLWSRTSVESEWVIDEAEEGKQNGRLLSVKIDDVELPLGFRQLQAATLVDWLGDVEDNEFQLLRRRLHGLIPLGADPPPSPPAPPPQRVSPPRFALRHPAAEPTLLLAVVFLVPNGLIGLARGDGLLASRARLAGLLRGLAQRLEDRRGSSRPALGAATAPSLPPPRQAEPCLRAGRKGEP